MSISGYSSTDIGSTEPEWTQNVLSQTIEYALRAMIHLAGLAPNQAANCESIAARTKVPQGYLSKILRDLVIADLITSRRGPNGGFALARAARAITMLDVVNAVDRIERLTKCPLGNPGHVELCPLHRRMDNAVGLIEHEFRQTTLAEVLESRTAGGPTCRALMTPSVRGKSG